MQFWSISDIHLDTEYNEQYDSKFFCHDSGIYGIENDKPVPTTEIE